MENVLRSTDVGTSLTSDKRAPGKRPKKTKNGDRADGDDDEKRWERFQASMMRFSKARQELGDAAGAAESGGGRDAVSRGLEDAILGLRDLAEGVAEKIDSALYTTATGPSTAHDDARLSAPAGILDEHLAETAADNDADAGGAAAGDPDAPVHPRRRRLPRKTPTGKTKKKKVMTLSACDVGHEDRRSYIHNVHYCCSEC